MPLGGIGTGSMALGSDGGWRQIQLHNVGNHRGDLPGTFMALRTSQHEPIHDQTIVLQAARSDGGALGTPAVPMFNDDLVPAWQRELVAEFGGTSTVMTGTYPVAEVAHHTGGPVSVVVRATSPMTPGDADASGYPAVLLDVTLTNHTDTVTQAWLAHSVHNAVGLDPHLNPEGVRAAGYGGNVNTMRRRRDGRVDLVMENPSLDPSSPWAGQLVLGCLADEVVALPCYERPRELVDFLRLLAPWGDHTRAAAAPSVQAPQNSSPSPRYGPSPAGRTWLGALVGHTVLGPRESRTVRFVLAWYFPNRMVDFVQFGPDRPELGATRFWLGNHYASRWADAVEVADDLFAAWDRHWDSTLAWTSAMDRLDLPARWRTHLATQPVPLRTPTSFRTHDGAFYGFEGVLGASTGMWSGDVGGSCPLNCTHVWNYAMAASALFPSLERSMRETEFDVMQAPSGALPHRVFMPPYLEQFGDGPIGGPVEAALDGMCGAVLKTYRELRRGAVDVAWVRRRWGKVCALMDHIVAKWDPEGTGLLSGIQPSTHDIGLHGTNTYMGTYWLAALRAAEELARIVGDDGRASEWRGRFETSSARYDEECFDGEHYVQKPDPDLPEEHQWGIGCLSDQLIGQWWAHTLDLGHLLPEEHVRTALRSVVRWNFGEIRWSSGGDEDLDTSPARSAHGFLLDQRDHRWSSGDDHRWSSSGDDHRWSSRGDDHRWSSSGGDDHRWSSGGDDHRWSSSGDEVPRVETTGFAQRPYAVAGESGLVMCTWPNGGRPEVPTLYCDEVWTGVEYQVAAHCLQEGLREEAERILGALWERHDGRRRNPFNEVECGDHYARAMAGWSVLEAELGLAWNALDGSFRAARKGTLPLLTGTGWGEVEASPDGVRARCHNGSIGLRSVVVGDGARWRLSGTLTPEDGWVAMEGGGSDG
nr:GH116 family glycosyl-hydrolase [Tessaracoccus sp. OS52]